MKNLSVALVVLVSCQASDKSMFPVGGPNVDASPQAIDAHVDAPPPTTRTCVNGDATLNNGNEQLVLAIVCQSLADQILAHALVTGGSGSNAESKFVDFTIVCNPTHGLPANNLVTFPDTQILRATKVTTALFTITCT